MSLMVGNIRHANEAGVVVSGGLRSVKACAVPVPATATNNYNNPSNNAAAIPLFCIRTIVCPIKYFLF